MLIIVPMAGSGARFAARGYAEPKPLVAVDGRPMVEHVVDMFPAGSDFLFICNEEHLTGTDMGSVLERAAPGCMIVSIPRHKLGPVHSVAAAFGFIEDGAEAVVNYCDFGAYWDFGDFVNFARWAGADGAVPAYRGFHPHSLNGNNYAFMRNDGARMLEIREKEPFTDDRMSEYASSGTYYFRTGGLLKRYFAELMENGPAVGGEFYASMALNFLVRDGLKVVIYELQHMLQWGTPEDLDEYAGWSDCFRAMVECPGSDAGQPRGGVNIVPMAGRGERFAREGFAGLKQVLPVGGKPMFARAASALPGAERNIFVCLRGDVVAYPQIADAAGEIAGAEVVELDSPTEGQAVTAAAGLERVAPGEAFHVGACDNGMIWDRGKYAALLNDDEVDAVVWTARGHRPAVRAPHMYGWVRTEDGVTADGVSVKRAVSDEPWGDHAIVGTFYFRSREIYMEGLERLRETRGEVGGEYYIDSVIGALVELGRRVKIFEVRRWVCWGTPDEYRTYLYWQSFFHKCEWHPYRLELDAWVTRDAAAALDEEYRRFSQPHGGGR